MLIKCIRSELIYCFSLVILACILVADLWLFDTQPQTFDGWVHLITFDSFAQSMQAGSWPVSWTDSVAHYGYPLGQIAHQTTNYLGGILFLLFGSVTLAYTATLTLILIMTGLLMYVFLRFFVIMRAAFSGSALFLVAPYRFLNTYVRGALPELMAVVFILVILIGFAQFFKNKKNIGLVVSGLGVAGLTVTHPMMLLLASPLLAAFFIYFIWEHAVAPRLLIAMICFLLFGLMMGGYYIVPLLGEIKYFYQGSAQNQISEGQFLSLDAFYAERWAYFDPTTTGIRENRFQLGVIELLIVLAVAGLFFYKKRFFAQPRLVGILIATFFVLALLLLEVSKPLYDVIPLLSGIQFPWRWLGILAFIPPLLFAFLVQQLSFKNMLLIVLFLWIALFRIPETYSKNFMYYPPERYSATSVNIHSTTMNTIWSGVTTDYPTKEAQAEIIGGTGGIELMEYSPTHRSYRVSANEPVRIVEHTFYFPGWRVFVNGQEQLIEFQDHEYRGVITYKIDQAGEHQVDVVYTDTKVRLLGKLVSLAGLLAIISCTVLIWKNPAILKSK